jgi:putative ABC transport system ATP-binding protein
VDKSIYRFLLRHSLKEQIVLLVATAVSFPFLYYSYDVPKLIINHIKDASRVILHKGMDAAEPHFLFGFKFDAFEWLMLLSFIFLALTLINGGFKYFINVYKGRLGERMLRRMRYTLYSMILCFPLPHFKKVSSGELIPMITAEVEPLGGFVGEAIVTPIFQGGLLLVPLVFIFVQDPWLGLAAIALYPVQGWMIPKLQRRVNQLGKERVRTLRKLSDRIGETVSGVAEIRANDTSRFERADFTDRLGVIYHIRYRIYLLKFLMKYINNSFDKVTPFFFFSIGGYLVFKGQLDLGALVAVINAQKDLAAPWRELLDFYQLKEDSRIKYEQVVEQFSPPGIVEEQVQLTDPEHVEPLTGQLVASNVSLVEDSRLKLLEGISFQMPLATHVAVIGSGASGKEELSFLLARLMLPTSGKITIGDQNIADWPDAIAGRRIGYVDQSAYVFSTTIGDNLLYALRHSPPRNGKADDSPEAIAQRAELIEAERAGNLAIDIHADWTDYAAAGADGPEALKSKALEALSLALMEDDVYQMGLRGVIDPVKRPDVADLILDARRDLRGRFNEPAIAPLVELFDETRFNSNASVGENLLFGTPVGPVFDIERLGEHPYVLSVLDKVGLTGTMLMMGREAASIMVELFAELASGHEFFEQFSFINSDDMPEFQALLGRVGKGSLDDIKAEDRTRLLNLPFRLIQARHRLDLIDESFQHRIVEARQVFARDLPEALKGAVEFFDRERYNAAATLQDNILFGKVAYGHAQGDHKVGQLIQEVLQRRGLRHTVMEVGLAYPVGTAGARLSVAQRQKLALARATLKRPDLLVLNEALGPLDSGAQSRVLENLRAEFKGRGLFAMLNRPSLSREFDRILVMRGGRLVEQGSFAELDREGTYFHELLSAG